MKTEIHPEGTCTELNLSRELANAVYYALEEYGEELPEYVVKAYRNLREHYEEMMEIEA